MNLVRIVPLCQIYSRGLELREWIMVEVVYELNLSDIDLPCSAAVDFPLTSDRFGCDDNAPFAGDGAKGKNGHDTKEAYSHAVNFTTC